MPSTSRPLPRQSRVQVRHPKFGEKWVLRSQLGSLSANWKIVRPKKTSAKKPDTQPSASLSAHDPAAPESEKENADAVQPDNPGRD